MVRSIASRTALLRVGAGMLSLMGVMASSAGAETGGSSADKLEEVVVTAERREASLQKTPMNITVISGDVIAQQGMSDMQQALSAVPGVSVQGQVRGFLPSIRGLGTDLPPGSSQGSVATEVDGVYDIRAEVGRVGYFDLERIEVLAGPQGTLYGVNSDGGVVNVISRNPVLGSYQTRGAVTVGNYNLVRGEATVNLPVSDSSALRVAVAGINRDGFLTNAGTDDNVGMGARIKYLYQPSDSVSLLLGTELSRLGGKGQGSVAGYPGDTPTTSDPWTDQSVGTGADATNQWDRYHSTKYWAELKWNTSLGTLSFTPSYKSDYDWQNSCGMGPSCALQGDPIKLEQNSEELRFASNGSGPLTWAVGAYHFGYFEVESGMGPGNPPPVTYRQTSDGFFGELRYAFTGAFRGIAGARETRDWKKETDLPSSGKHWSHFDYRLGLEYDVAPQSMAYVTVATGYRPGGYNFDGSTFETEEVRDVEVGIKNRFLDDRVQLNVDAYYYDFKNYQLLDFYFSGPCSALAPPPPTYNLTARNLGLDVGLQAAISKADSLSLQLAYMNSKFTSKQTISYNTPDSCPPGAPADAEAIVETYTIDGSAQPRTPKLSGTLQYEHKFPLPGGASIAAQPAVHYSDSYYVHPVQNIYSYQPSYTTYEFSLLYGSADGKWNLSLWGRNLGDKAIKTQLNPMIIGEPRTYGFTVSAQF